MEIPLRFILLLLFCWTFSLKAQRAEKDPGVPFISSFSAKDYGAHSQNWAVVQDPRGVMYFGNNNGVLEFDGAHWRLIPVSNNSIVRSLGADSNGVVYVGAVGELGYLKPDSAGKLIFYSLLDQLPEEERAFADVWRIEVNSNGVHFMPRDRIFRWTGNEFGISHLKTNVFGCMAGGNIYACQPGTGLTKLVGDSLVPVSAGDQMKDFRLYFMLAYDEETFVVGSAIDGLKLFKPGSGLLPWNPEHNKTLVAHRPYHAVRLAGGRFAVSSYIGGVFILDRAGQIVEVFNKDVGLPDNGVWFICSDIQNGLWLGTNRGIARIELGQPWVAYPDENGPSGTVEAITRFDNKLYVCTSSGVFFLENGVFHRVTDLTAIGWCFQRFRSKEKDVLLAGTSAGVFEIKGNSAVRIFETNNAFSMHQSVSVPSTVLVGSLYGLDVLKHRNGHWEHTGKLERISEEIRMITEDAPGIFWAGTHFNGVIEFRANLNDGLKIEDMVRYTKKQGLETERSVKVYHVNGEITLVSEKGIYRPQSRDNQLLKTDLILDSRTSGSLGISRLVQDNDGILWLCLPGEQTVGVARPTTGNWFLLDRSFSRRLPQADYYALLPEKDVLWAGGTDGLFRLDRNFKESTNPDFSTLIRAVISDHDSVHYYGAGTWRSQMVPLELRHEQKSVIFQFSAPSYDAMEANEFSYRLDGQDDDWSDWSKETKKEYTNLFEGLYHFRVRSRNVYGTLGAEAIYVFRVHPPWYRTYWAFGTYAVLFTLVLIGLVRWRSSRLERDKALLKAAVEKGTEEIREYAGRLEETQKELVRQERMATLGQLTSVVSHELRNPLGTIRNAFFTLKERLQDDSEKFDKILDRAERNILRCDKIVEELLDYSRVKEPFLEMTDVDEWLMSVLDDYKTPQEIGIDRELSSGAKTGIDRDKIRRCLVNLMDNACHAILEKPRAEPRGKIKLSSRVRDGQLRISVRDNGVGIPEENLQMVFEPLFSTKGFGVGLGMTIVSQIMKSVGGDFTIESVSGEGTEATLHIPVSENKPVS